MKKNEKIAEFSVETKTYPREAVFAAANTFSEKAFVRVREGKRGCVLVELRGKPGQRHGADFEGEFYNELLHHALRLKISVRHQALREKIVTQALLSAQGPGRGKPAVSAGEKHADAKLEREIEKLLKEAESGDYRKDPLGIAVPWEKKHGSGKPGK